MTKIKLRELPCVSRRCLFVITFEKNRDPLPNPNGEFSASVLSQAIVAANQEVVQYLYNHDVLTKRSESFKKNNVYYNKLRAQMGENNL